MRTHPLIPAFAGSFLLLIGFAAGVGVIQAWPNLVTAVATVAIAGFSIGTLGLWLNSLRKEETSRSQIYARLLVLRGNLLEYQKEIREAANDSVELGHFLLNRQLSRIEEARQEIREIVDEDLIEDEEALLEITAVEVGLTHTIVLAETVAEKPPNRVSNSTLVSIADKLHRLTDRLTAAKDAIPASQHGIIDDRDDFFDRLQNRTYKILQ